MFLRPICGARAACRSELPGYSTRATFASPCNGAFRMVASYAVRTLHRRSDYPCRRLLSRAPAVDAGGQEIPPVVSKVVVLDEFSPGRLTTEYRYHMDLGTGRTEYRGFGYVEALKNETFADYVLPRVYQLIAAPNAERKNVSYTARRIDQPVRVFFWHVYTSTFRIPKQCNCKKCGIPANRRVSVTARPTHTSVKRRAQPGDRVPATRQGSRPKEQKHRPGRHPLTFADSECSMH